MTLNPITAIAMLCRRLHAIALLCLLRFRKAEAEWLAVQIESDMLVAPAQLAQLRATISQLDGRMRALEAQR